MHSTTFTQIAQAADEFATEVVAFTEDMTEEGPLGKGAAVLYNADNGEFAFTKFAVQDEVEFFGTQYVGRNMSKALKYLSDYTLDRRPLVYLEDGSQVENIHAVAA